MHKYRFMSDIMMHLTLIMSDNMTHLTLIMSDNMMHLTLLMRDSMIYFNIACTNIANILCGIHFNTTNYTTCEKIISISFYSKLHRDMNKNCDAFVRLLIIPLNPFSHDGTLKCRFEKFLIFIWKGMGAQIPIYMSDATMRR